MVGPLNLQRNPSTMRSAPDAIGLGGDLIGKVGVARLAQFLNEP